MAKKGGKRFREEDKDTSHYGIIVLVLLAVVCCVLVFVLIRLMTETDDKHGSTYGRKNTGVVGSYTPQDNLMIDTPYGDLYYPADLEKQTRIAIDQTEEKLTLSFYCAIDNGEILLYAVSFGQTGENEGVIGSIVNAKGEKVNVNVYSPDFSPETGWEIEHEELIFRMKDSVNTILSNLPKLEGFEFVP